MFDKIKAALIGSFSLSALLLSLFIYGLPIHILAPFKLILRAPSWQTRLTAILEKVYLSWIRLIIRVYDATHRIDWDIRGVRELKAERWYFVNANHQAWTDIPVMYRTFFGHIPAFKKRFQDWLNTLWEKKDEEIDKILEAEGSK